MFPECAAQVGKFSAMVPVAVVSGFSSGLALLIARSQLHEFQIAHGQWAPLEQLALQVGTVVLMGANSIITLKEDKNTANTAFLS
jgi:MFS superfamily sulfate permease-like transporter